MQRVIFRTDVVTDEIGGFQQRSGVTIDDTLSLGQLVLFFPVAGGNQNGFRSRTTPRFGVDEFVTNHPGVIQFDFQLFGSSAKHAGLWLAARTVVLWQVRAPVPTGDPHPMFRQHLRQHAVYLFQAVLV